MGEKYDVLIKGGVLVKGNGMFKTDVAVQGHLIVGLGSYHGRDEIDVSGRYVCPGFIDGHVHIESSMVPVPEYARAVEPSFLKKAQAKHRS